MEVWILNRRSKAVTAAILIRSIDSETMQVRLEDGQRISIPRRHVFDTQKAALLALSDPDSELP